MSVGRQWKGAVGILAAEELMSCGRSGGHLLPPSLWPSSTEQTTVVEKKSWGSIVRKYLANEQPHIASARVIERNWECHSMRVSYSIYEVLHFGIAQTGVKKCTDIHGHLPHCQSGLHFRRL